MMPARPTKDSGRAGRAGTGLVMLLIGSICAVEAAPQAFRAEVELVRVGVGIYDPEHGVVPKLTVADFRVYDNGEERDIELFLEPADAPLHVALVVDASGSMEDAWPAVVRAAQQFLASLAPRDCAYVLPFDDRVAPGRWGRRDDGWASFLDGVRPGGGTALENAVVFALKALRKNAEGEHFGYGTLPPPRISLQPDEVLPTRFELQLATDRAAGHVLDPVPEPDIGGCAPAGRPQAEAQTGIEARRAVVLLSDGRSGDHETTALRVARASRAAAMPVFTVILGDAGASGRQTMIWLARESGGLVVEARGAAQLFGAFDAVMGFLEATYVLAFRPPARTAAVNESTPGEWREIRVELVGHPELRPLYASGYQR